MLRRLFSTKKCLSVDQLESIYKLSTAVNSNSSKLEKQAIIKQYPACHSILKRIYDPHLRHHVSSKAAIKYLKKYPITDLDKAVKYTNVNDLLDALSSRTIKGHAACAAIASFYNTYCKTKPHQDIFWRIIDRNLKMGVSVITIRRLLSARTTSENTINKEKQSTINIQVALAFPMSANKNGLNIQVDSWYVSQKLDGIRCITIIQKDKNGQYDIEFYSRTGRPFTSLQKVKNDLEDRLEELGDQIKDAFVLDGEICAYSNDLGRINEDFLKAVSQIRRLNEQMENPVYQIFDCITLHDFLKTKGEQLFAERQAILKNFVGNIQRAHVKMVKQIKLESLEQLNRLKQKSIQMGWEGLILRKDVFYEGKRTRNMLKIKEWEDAEYIVKSIETGYMRMPDTGEDKLVLTSVNIEHKGNIVSVGSGFSIQKRIIYAENPNLILGKPITVRYFSEFKKENGTVSLRFPTVKAVYEEGERDV
ncbi:uncharacterized protein BX663DRAFT_498812 [Cokeromyces recurvatus]|uniref:uncharacterized protein n=1 Tax=Cokeromyces recurvatus TaxID=90255 RepID=UPI00221EBFD5|nr:uncharacterized protein BX663DRAFT_498812 [Cokeromyces recurvatus]KAI7906111.1 hypothetical protein BX663DRAFT_498812 [Cokeromyces recurvatus]